MYSTGRIHYPGSRTDCEYIEWTTATVIVQTLLYDIMFSLLTMLEAGIDDSHKSTYIQRLITLFIKWHLLITIKIKWNVSRCLDPWGNIYVHILCASQLPTRSRYCIVLYYEALYWWPDWTELSYRHSSGVVRNLHSALAEWRIFNLRSISPQGTHLLIARRRNSITSVLASISWMSCLNATCEPRTINLLITGERITFTM